MPTLPQPARPLLRAGPPLPSRRTVQARGLWLILLLVGHELQAVSASTTSGHEAFSHRGAGEQNGVNVTEARLLKEPGEAVTTFMQDAGAPVRNLAIPTVENWQWPVGTLLTLDSYSAAGDRVQVSSDSQITLLAGQLYSKIEIKATGKQWGVDHDLAKIKLVTSLADRHNCEQSVQETKTKYSLGEDFKAYNVPVATVVVTDNNLVPPALVKCCPGNMGFSTGGLQLTNAADTLSATATQITFMWGGSYKLCYTPDGGFGSGDGTQKKNNVVPTLLKVIGVKSPCDHDGVFEYDGCIEKERWDCFFGYKGENYVPCNFNIKADGGRKDWAIESGSRSRMTWTQAYGADTTSGLTPVFNEKLCTADEPEKTKFGIPLTGDSVNTKIYLDLDKMTEADMPVVASTETSPFTLAACYCPNFAKQSGNFCDSDPSACCDEYQEYLQQFGVIYYWTVNICDRDNLNCNPPYMRVIPQQNFVIRVECPPGGGCLGTTDNRIKFIAHSSANDKPNWMEDQGCKSTTVESEYAVWPQTRTDLSGGSNTGYKIWSNEQVKFRLSIKQKLDVCYANNKPELKKSWFRIGTVKTIEAFGFASKIGVGSSVKTLKYVNHPGSITLYGGITSGTTLSPYDSNKFSGKALLNILSYDRDPSYGLGDQPKTMEKHQEYYLRIPSNFQSKMDNECQKEEYYPTLMQSPPPFDKLGAKTYLANVDTGTVSNYLTFSGETKDRKLTILRSGVIAVCYCAILSSQNQCAEPRNWVYAGRMTIRGPVGQQQWIFPTEIVVKIEVTGWGFTGNDKIRIIPAASSCSNNNNEPDSDISFKVGCPQTQPLPAGASGCKFAEATESIGLSVRTASSTSNYIKSMDKGQQASILTFSQSVKGVLEQEDVITIDMARIRVNSKELASMTPQETFEAYKLAAEMPFQDTPTEKYLVGHRVTEVKANNIVHDLKMQIPVGWSISNTDSFTFHNQEGFWTRRNKEETQEEIKGMTAKSGLKACWGVTDAGITKYYAQAGEVEFKTPPPMKAAKINLSTKMDKAEAPVVISFKTGAGREEYSRTKTGASALMLRFLDASASRGKLVPLKTGDKPPNIGNIPDFQDSDEILPANAKQMICGRLFVELWSSDAQGFPMPSGCYYSKKYKDNEERDIIPNFQREFFAVFPEGSGLRSNTDYQIVMNTLVQGVAKGDVLLDLYTMCVGNVGCERPYQVFEKGSAEASMSTEAPATLSDPKFGTDGFMLQRGSATTGVVNLSEMNILQFKLTGGEDSGNIVANCLVRVYLWPLTLWAVGAGQCTADCQKYHANNRKCEGPVGCSPEEVVIGSDRRNIIKIQLPTEMDAITGTTTHTIKVTGLTLPVRGYFPSRVGAQVTRPDDTRPDYKTATGFLMKDADAGQTTGRLVIAGRTGYGPKPFSSDTQNILYLRLSFGATVWNLGQNNAAFVEITLPMGYTCSVPDDGMPDWSLDLFKADNNNDGYYDSPRGFMSAGTSDGDWESSNGKKCIYEVRPYMAIWAGMIVYVKVTVDNPGEPMRKTEEKNVWSIKLQSKGSQAVAVAAFDQSEVNFITLQQEEELLASTGIHWGGNAAVLNALTYETLQPTQFRRSTTTYQQIEDLYVFFRTRQYIGRDGFVLLDSPIGFDFGVNCLAQALPEEYYVFRGDKQDLLLPLKNIEACAGQRFPSTASTYNRARIKVGGILDLEKHYGFKIRITHPLFYESAQHIDWYLWTQDDKGYGVDGSTGTIKFNRNQASSQVQPYHKAWGMYNAPFLNHFEVHMADMRPNSISSVNSIVTIFPFKFDVFTDTSMRVTAPLGYVWDANADSFTGRYNHSTADIMEAPLFENENQLVWNSISFANDQTYGFTAKIKVPDFSPVVSSNAFFIELGWNKAIIDDRLMATAVPANPVKTLVDTQVSYASNLEAYATNRMEFRFKSITTLQKDDGLIVKGDVNTQGFTFSCPPIPLEGTMTLPSDLNCNTDKGNDDLPRVALKVTNTPLPAGTYAFEVATINPASRKNFAGKWMFGTFAKVSEYPDSPPIDRSLDAPGFTINGPILDARLIAITDEQRSLTMRNDRPQKPNQLIFRFQVRNKPANVANLQLRGPRGFEFEEDCLPSVKTNANEVFGPNTASIWPPDYAQWPTPAAPTACVGTGRFATLTIPTGLGRRNLYAFRIGVYKNPDKTPEWNKWTIDYIGESSEPFEGFIVWTFTHTSVTAVSLAKSPTGANIALTKIPITITFRPYNRIPFKCTSCPSGGLLRLSAPVGFEFVEDNGDCHEPLLQETGGAVVFTPADMSCQVEHKTKLLLELIGDKFVDGGRDYTLIVNTYNPTSTSMAAQWAMDSFTERSAEPHKALDESTILGQDINNVLNTWTVINKYNRRNGKAKVNDVEFTMQFPDPLKDDDEILVHGPKGFDLEGNPELGDCKEFRWPPNNNPLPNLRGPLCSCADQICTMRFNIKEFKDPAFAQNQNIKFTLATENPTRTPFVTDNFWKVSHMRGGIVRSSHIYPSWSINPQLEDVVINLIGTDQAAGKTSDLEFTFMPVSDADTLQIEALFPAEFDFGRATVPVPYDIDNLSERQDIIINRCSIKAGRQFSIQIKSVKLGRGGGQTKFNLITWADETRTAKKDEKLEYEGGFRLPGEVTIESKKLKSRYEENRQLYSVKSLFQARVGEEAKAEFTLMFSQKVTAAQKLIISCEGEGAYELKVSPFVIIGKERVETSVARAENKLTEIEATLKPGRPATEVALQADTQYKIIMWVLPKQGTNTWVFKTSDGGQYPTNTNDGVTTGFRPVERMSLKVSAIRSPPRAIIDVTLNVDQGSAVVLELLVIAPPSFVFPREGCGDMCQAGNALGSTGRRTATIASPTGEPLTRLNNLRIQVQTPERTPESQSWFVEGRGQGKGVTTGWGEDVYGFRVNQMANSLVSYAGVAGLRAAQITFRFVLEVNAGSEIAIEPPSGYLLSCSTEGALKQISLPGSRPGCTDDPLVLMLTTTLTAGEYAFGVAVDLPPQEPTPNSFNIIIRDRDNNVVDAAYELPGVAIEPLPVTNPTLSWTRAEASQPSVITIGITFTGDYNMIKALLITFPNGFIHEVQVASDVQNLNRRFPVAASQGRGWADTSETDRIKIMLDDSEDSTTIAADTYSWSFPVILPPTEMPRYNVWFFSLCSDRSCREPTGRGVIVSFPMAGFRLNEVSPASMKNEISAAHRRTGTGFHFAIGLAICSMLSRLFLLASSPLP